MARRDKRASMREGPLSDLFRSTSEDAPVDPPEAPRYGRQDPAEAQKAEDGGARDAGPAAAGDPPSPATAQETVPPTTSPTSDAPQADDVPLQQEGEPTFFDQEIETSTEPAPERLKRVFAEEPQARREQFVPENPRYGRDEPEYEPPGSGEPHQPVIKVVGVGGAGVNAVNRMVDARVPGVEFMAVNTDLQSLQLCVADITVHIGDEQALDLVLLLEGGAMPDLGIGAGAEAARLLVADVDGDVGDAELQ
jgi:cell division protein FtsZ